MTQEKQITMSQARRLAIQWVWKIEFNVDVDDLWMLSPTTINNLIQMLRDDSKDPILWTEQECEDFVMEMATSTAGIMNPVISIKETHTTQKG